MGNCLALKDQLFKRTKQQPIYTFPMRKLLNEWNSNQIDLVDEKIEQVCEHEKKKLLNFQLFIELFPELRQHEHYNTSDFIKYLFNFFDKSGDSYVNVQESVARLSIILFTPKEYFGYVLIHIFDLVKLSQRERLVESRLNEFLQLNQKFIVKESIRVKKFEGKSVDVQVYKDMEKQEQRKASRNELSDQKKDEDRKYQKGVLTVKYFIEFVAKHYNVNMFKMLFDCFHYREEFEFLQEVAKQVEDVRSAIDQINGDQDSQRKFLKDSNIEETIKKEIQLETREVLNVESMSTMIKKADPKRDLNVKIELRCDNPEQIVYVVEKQWFDSWIEHLFLMKHILDAGEIEYLYIRYRNKPLEQRKRDTKDDQNKKHIRPYKMQNYRLFGEYEGELKHISEGNSSRQMKLEQQFMLLPKYYRQDHFNDPRYLFYSKIKQIYGGGPDIERRYGNLYPIFFYRVVLTSLGKLPRQPLTKCAVKKTTRFMEIFRLDDEIDEYKLYVTRKLKFNIKSDNSTDITHKYINCWVEVDLDDSCESYFKRTVQKEGINTDLRDLTNHQFLCLMKKDQAQRFESYYLTLDMVNSLTKKDKGLSQEKGLSEQRISVMAIDMGSVNTITEKQYKQILDIQQDNEVSYGEFVQIYFKKDAETGATQSHAWSRVIEMLGQTVKLHFVGKSYTCDTTYDYQHFAEIRRYMHKFENQAKARLYQRKGTVNLTMNVNMSVDANQQIKSTTQQSIQKYESIIYAKSKNPLAVFQPIHQRRGIGKLIGNKQGPKVSNSYMTTILYCLLSTPYFEDYLLKKKYKFELKDGTKSSTIIKELADIAVGLKEEKDNQLNINSLWDKFLLKYDAYKDNEQHYPDEFLTHLLYTIDAELTNYQRINELENKQPGEQELPEDSINNKFFQLEISREITCESCKTKNVIKSKNYILDLPIDQDQEILFAAYFYPKDRKREDPIHKFGIKIRMSRKFSELAQLFLQQIESEYSNISANNLHFTFVRNGQFGKRFGGTDFDSTLDFLNLRKEQKLLYIFQVEDVEKNYNNTNEVVNVNFEEGSFYDFKGYSEWQIAKLISKEETSTGKYGRIKNYEYKNEEKRVDLSKLFQFQSKLSNKKQIIETIHRVALENDKRSYDFELNPFLLAAGQWFHKQQIQKLIIDQILRYDKVSQSQVRSKKESEEIMSESKMLSELSQRDYSQKIIKIQKEREDEEWQFLIKYLKRNSGQCCYFCDKKSKIVEQKLDLVEEQQSKKYCYGWNCTAKFQPQDEDPIGCFMDLKELQICIDWTRKNPKLQFLEEKPKKIKDTMLILQHKSYQETKRELQVKRNSIDLCLGFLSEKDNKLEINCQDSKITVIQKKPAVVDEVELQEPIQEKTETDVKDKDEAKDDKKQQKKEDKKEDKKEQKKQQKKQERKQKKHIKKCPGIIGLERTFVSKVPNVLIIKLRRFKKSNGMIQKLQNKIQFRQQITLQIIAQPFNQDKYELYGIVCFKGNNIKDGYWYSYIRKNKKYWVKCQRDRNYYMDMTAINYDQIYMLFYRKHNVEGSLVTLIV